jgi:chlorophyll/bacteriochlorophyll a synthase
MSSLPTASLGRRSALPAVVELLKPVTWFPPMWAFACGAVSASGAGGGSWSRIGLGVVLAGPLVCAASQVVNDWYDRDVDAINEPHRPIPSGRIPGRWGLHLARLWTALSLLLATALGPVVVVATALALVLAWAYSAPPLRLKRNGWYGNAAVGFSYEGLAWITGAAVMCGGVPDARSVALAFLYSVGAHGIMTLNDFKSIEGDKRLGVASLPVQLGVQGAARTACWVMLVPQVFVVALLAQAQREWHALAVAALIVGQGVLMRRFLSDPKRHATWYSGLGVTIYVSGMMVAAFGLRSLSG